MKKFSFSQIRRNAMPLLAILAMTGYGSHARAATVYAFAQQKVYNMTLTSSAGPGNLIPTANLNVSTNDSANLSGFIGVTNQLPAIDAQQSKLGTFLSPGPPAGRVDPPENYIVAAPFASSPGINVLGQANPTAIGLQNAVDTTIPTTTSFNPGDQFSRSDVFTAYPSGNPVGGIVPGSGTPPPGYSLTGQGIASNQLFANVGAGTTMGFDTVAEGLLNSSVNSISTAVSSWVVTGTFTLQSPGTVEFDFEMVERLAVFSDSPFITQANASNTLSLLISDDNNIPLATPTSNRTLTAPNAGEITYNANSIVAGHVWTGPNGTNAINFQSGVLLAGNYHYSIQGVTQVDLKIVPEPSTYALMSLASATIGGLALKRRKQTEGTTAQA